MEKSSSGKQKWLRIENCFGFPMGFAASALTALISVSLHVTRHHTAGLIAFTVIVVAVSALTYLWASLGTTLVAWAMYSGFILGRSGVLILNSESAHAAAVLGSASVASYLIGTALRWSVKQSRMKQRQMKQHRAGSIAGYSSTRPPRTLPLQTRAHKPTDIKSAKKRLVITTSGK